MESQDVTPEVWRPVPGYEGWYSVSNLGRVRTGENRNHGRRPLTLRTTVRHPRGYYAVILYLHDKSRRWYVHALVAAAFIGPRPPGLEINHKDGNKGNNVPNNLEYVSPLENKRHACTMWLQEHGERHHFAKLKEADVRGIISLLGSMKQKDIATLYGIHKATINDIALNKSWRHIRR